MKRTRAHRSGAGEEAECPVCLEKFGERTQTQPFQCSHLFCRSCDRGMKRTSDNRCPVCRCPRRGMSREEAEPDPTRNHDPPSIDEVLPQEFAEALQNITHQALSFATRSYGRRPRGAQVVVHRPDTGHVMFFRHEPPVDADAESTSGQAALVVDETADQAGGRLTAEQARTFASILGVEADALQALLNVPEVSVHEWRRMREAHRGRRGT